MAGALASAHARAAAPAIGPLALGLEAVVLALGVLAMLVLAARGLLVLWRALKSGLVEKELRHLFLSPIAWFTLAAFAFVNGFVLLFLLEGFQARPNDSLVRIFFGGQNPWFWILQLVVVPAITMRLVAEERQSGTLELLLTAPVREPEVVLAKFLAAWAFYGTLWLTTAVPLGFAFHHAAPPGFWEGFWEARAGGPLELWSQLGQVMDPGPIAAAYLGTWLMGGAWIAVGLAASSVCRNQVVAFMGAFVALVALFAVGFLDGLVQTEPVAGFREVLRFVSFPMAFDGFPRGLVDSRAVIWFTSWIVLGLALATRGVESRRWR